MWASGLFFTRVGRRVLIGGVVAAFLAHRGRFPDAILGVQSRFANTTETTGRFWSRYQSLPPVAMALNDYPLSA